MNYIFLIKKYIFILKIDVLYFKKILIFSFFRFKNNLINWSKKFVSFNSYKFTNLKPYQYI
jgi:hypothetical protein